MKLSLSKKLFEVNYKEPRSITSRREMFCRIAILKILRNYWENICDGVFF